MAFATGVAVVTAGAAMLPLAGVAQAGEVATTSFVVVAKDASSLAAARAAVQAAGGTVTSEDGELALLTATSSAGDFATRTDASPAVYGVAANRKVGVAPKQDKVTADLASLAKAAVPPAPAAAEPLAGLQWDMAMIGATSTGSYAKQRGKGVVVGIMDTGVDGTHPDIKPNFSSALSRNFVTDMPDIDGPCEHPSCVDPVDEDDDGHGTHVAGTIGAAINGIGMAGVAPDVTIANIRAGQDSGYFFLEPTVKALRYAGDAGINVVNMSFYIDPWLYNCKANPADSPAAQAEQRAIIEATQRALEYAHQHKVTLISALGNENSDLGNPPVDESSPDYPAKAAYPRTIDNSTCLSMPTEGKHVVGVSSVGPSGKKADYSNYGLEQNEVAAPGGFFRDYAGTPKTQQPGNLIIAPMPRNVAVANGVVDPTTGASLSSRVIAQCSAAGPANCTYWQYLQGTSMASPHAVGVAALIVGQYGEKLKNGRLTMDPDTVERVLERTAVDTACPAPVITYTAEGRDSSYDAACIGSPRRNSIYGDGIINADRAVSAPRA